jgi:nickel/cobalt exporter
MLVLAGTAASIGFIHTLLGPDHYLPFVMMGRARQWSAMKTALITAACGVGHVLSTVLIGSIGIGLGIAVTQIEGVNAVQGELAAWALIAFGAMYFVWGMRHAFKAHTHTHAHRHEDGRVHEYTHTHYGAHMHVHEGEADKGITPWVLFVIFLLGPCEALIPVLMFPAAQSSLTGVVFVNGVFWGSFLLRAFLR